MIRLKLKDVHNLENGLRIIVECNEYGVPIGKAAGIIAELFSMDFHLVQQNSLLG